MGLRPEAPAELHRPLSTIQSKGEDGNETRGQGRHHLRRGIRHGGGHGAYVRVRTFDDGGCFHLDREIGTGVAGYAGRPSCWLGRRPVVPLWVHSPRSRDVVPSERCSSAGEPNKRVSRDTAVGLQRPHPRTGGKGNEARSARARGGEFACIEPHSACFPIGSEPFHK
jgi:hypothetical protein